MWICFLRRTDVLAPVKRKLNEKERQNNELEGALNALSSWPGSLNNMLNPLLQLVGYTKSTSSTENDAPSSTRNRSSQEAPNHKECISASERPCARKRRGAGA